VNYWDPEGLDGCPAGIFCTYFPPFPTPGTGAMQGIGVGGGNDMAPVDLGGDNQTGGLAGGGRRSPADIARDVIAAGKMATDALKKEQGRQ
jgi:hypothetical protein